MQFQYIPCYCLSGRAFVVFHPYEISIHPMLLFISLVEVLEEKKICISIHPMLLFIFCKKLPTLRYFSYFNTSHVTVYHAKKGRALWEKGFQYIPCYCLSIQRKRNTLGFFQFQYIPCYCLSMIENTKPPGVPDFNTSHVTVYRLLWRRDRMAVRFQYIPCYCLSYVRETWCGLPVKFQYIPCYCLSFLQLQLQKTIPKFQYIPCYCLSELDLQELNTPANFNTSHVTVYHPSC